MPKGYHHLTKDQRCQLEALKRKNTPISEIAQDLNIHQSTIYKELARNPQFYDYQQAHAAALERRAKSSAPSKMTPAMLKLIQAKLFLQWSPEQISGWLRKHTDVFVSHETIYQFVWKDKRSQGTLYQHLRHHGKKYYKRGKSLAGRGCIPGRVDISDRPSIVDLKTRFGDWEVDTIIGKNHQGVLVSMVERFSKYTLMAPVSNKSAETVSNALIQRLSGIKKGVKSMTADNGKEFAYHAKISQALQTDVYFARPYRSWERGLNEHTNGLVRQYFPKKSFLNHLGYREIFEVEDRLNDRPRKVLGYRTPREVFLEEFSKVSGA